jgi:CelD/BcsL family acetyltransferase involved in cellulose biosynthesis
MIKIEEINTFKQALGLKQEWDKLVDEAGLDICLSFDFVASLWEAYLDKKDVILLLVKEENKLLAIFPLFIDKEKISIIFSINIIKPITNLTSWYNDFIIKSKTAEVIHAVLDYLGKRYNWDIFEITGDYTGVKNDSNVMRWINQERRYRFIKRKASDSFYIKWAGSWEEYLRKKSRKFRKNLKRGERKLKENVKYEIKYFTKPEDLDFVFEKIYEIESKCWKKYTIFFSKEREIFFRTYFKKIAPEGELLVAFLCMEEEYAAFDIYLIGKEKAYIITGSYKDKFQEYSPGFILTNHVLQKLTESKVSELDLGVGSWPRWRPMEWKKRWATGSKENYWVWLYNNKHWYVICYYYLRRLSGLTRDIMQCRKVDEK